MDRVDLVINISRITLSIVETDALSFGLKFTSEIKNHKMEKLIDLYHRHHKSDFHRSFVQGIIVASTNCQTDDPPLPKRYTAALKYLSSDHNITISPSDKGGGVVIMDSSVYN